MNLGLGELLVILVVILIFVGPKKLPAAGEALGKAMRSFKDALSGKESGKKTDAPEEDADEKNPEI